jgi:flagellar biosynthesis/type III secretory pathway M-ring protein FliF/YscJ
MRQKRATWVIAGVCAVLVGALIAFAFERPARQGESAATEAEDSHGDAAEEHGAGTDAGAEAQPTLSGEVVDGLRVVQVAARQFELEPSTPQEAKVPRTSDQQRGGVQCPGSQGDAR